LFYFLIYKYHAKLSIEHTIFNMKKEFHDRGGNPNSFLNCFRVSLVVSITAFQIPSCPETVAAYQVKVMLLRVITAFLIRIVPSVTKH